MVADISVPFEAESLINGVKIGLILPRLFKFSETVKKMTFSYTVFQG